MEFFDVIKNRHSIRAYENREVEEDKVLSILEGMRKAPSAGNLQAYKVYLVKNKGKRLELAKCALYQWFIYEAPLVLVFFADTYRSSSKYGKRGATLYSVQDATIACAYAQLSATALGLGSCWVGAFDEGCLRKVLNAPEHLLPVAILTIGYSAEKPEPTPRRELKEVVYYVL